MADALTHLATAALPGRAMRDGRLRAVLYVGVLLPDILYKTLLYCFGAPTWLCEPTHAPLGLIPFCYVGALLFEEAWRKRAFWALLGGSWLHLVIDVGKGYLGMGVIPWAFPFSMDRVELGLYTNADALWMMPAAAGVLILVEVAGRAVRRGPVNP